MITYIATNTINGKFYIGSTVCFETRKKQHLRSRSNYPFQNALRQNPEVFIWETVEDESKEPILEQSLLDMWYGKECCYNLSSSASRIGVELCSHKGEAHPLYGKPGTNKGKSWWVDASDNEIMSLECPGEGWVPGRSQSHAEKTSNSLRGKSAGEKHNMSKLTDTQRREIVEKGVAGFGGNVKQLALEYRVSGRQIRNIINHWK
jgi:hypothetical protein